MIVKNSEGSEVYLNVSSQSHGCWQKTPRHVLMVSLLLSVMATGRAPLVWYWIPDFQFPWSRLIHDQGCLTTEKPRAGRTVSVPEQGFSGRCYLIILSSKHACPLLWGEPLSLFPKAESKNVICYLGSH